MIHITEDEVKKLLNMDETIAAVEKAIKELSLGTAKMHPRVRMRIEEHEGDILVMSAYVPSLNIFSTKVVSSYHRNVGRGLPTINALLVVFDPKTGRPLATIDGAYLTAVRTGAISGVATKYLARDGASILTVIGCGVQARTQALAISKVRKLEKIYAYDIRREAAEVYAKEISDALNVETSVANSPAGAVSEADIVVTATTSKQPVIRWEWLKKGVHINAVGSYTPDARELDSETIIHSKVVIDYMPAALEEAGDVLIPISEGKFSAKRIYAELGEVIAGIKPGRVSDEEVTVFKSVGLAVQDAAAASVILMKLPLSR
ncbi:MAG: ornithine cyclodeaminase family protein [Nitrososphaerota archaeon]